MGYRVTLDDQKRKWLAKLIEKDLLKNCARGKTKLPKVPKIALILYNIYEYWKSPPDQAIDPEDYYAEHIQTLRNRKRVLEFLEEFIRATGITQLPDPEDKDYGKELFKRLTERIREEPDHIEKFREALEKKFPQLSEYTVALEEEKYARQWQQFVEKLTREVTEGEISVEVDDEFICYVEKMRRAERSEITSIARDLSKIVYLDPEIWELIIYAILSPYAPPLFINGTEARKVMHVLLIGDISTGKSKLINVIKEIAPKAMTVDFITESTLIGVATREGIEEGVLDKINDGTLLVHEFDKIERKLPLLRRIMDNDRILIAKYGHEKEIRVNVCVFASANPTADFFVEGIKLRDQVNMKEGMLSRFDILIPLTLPKERVDEIIDRMEIFSTNQPLSLREIKEILESVAAGMQTLSAVKLSKQQVRILKEAVKQHNRELRRRPLVIPRDLETLARLVNVIVAVNFARRKVENGIIKAKKSDIERAIYLWEYLIHLREQFYEKDERYLENPREAILKIILENGSIQLTELRRQIVEDLKLCSQATFYRIIGELVKAGVIRKEGRWAARVSAS